MKHQCQNEIQKKQCANKAKWILSLGSTTIELCGDCKEKYTMPGSPFVKPIKKVKK